MESAKANQAEASAPRQNKAKARHRLRRFTAAAMSEVVQLQVGVDKAKYILFCICMLEELHVSLFINMTDAEREQCLERSNE